MHIDKNSKVSNAQSTISSICRCFKTRTPEVMIQLWNSPVIPYLDYCCQLWNPKRKGETNKLDILQKIFTRRIAGANNLDYWERLQKLLYIPWKEDGIHNYVCLENLKEVGANITTVHSKHSETQNG